MYLHLQESIFYVYLYFDPSREESIYVGKGKGTRFRFHLRRKDKHPFTHRLQAMKQNKINPEINFIIKNVNETIAFFLEISAIHILGRKDLKSGPLLNLTDGGEGETGHVMSEESRKKMSIAKKGRIPWNKGQVGMISEETRLKLKHANKIGTRGFKHSPESISKMRQSKINRPWGNRKPKPCLPCSIDGGLTIFPSVSALKEALGQGKNGTRSPNFRLM